MWRPLDPDAVATGMLNGFPELIDDDARLAEGS
jgi:hypothetical protein